MKIFKEFSFEAAHLLPHVPSGHKCAQLHGHSFRLQLWVQGEIGEQTGWLVDYAEIDRAFEPLYEQLDHHYLNEIEGLENPTSEILACWVWERVSATLPGLCKVVIFETCNTGCVYKGPDQA